MIQFESRFAYKGQVHSNAEQLNEAGISAGMAQHGFPLAFEVRWLSSAK
jgi:hypothetical protein